MSSQNQVDPTFARLHCKLHDTMSRGLCRAFALLRACECNLLAVASVAQPQRCDGSPRRKRFMSELVVVGFDNLHEADRVLTDLNRLQTEYLVDLEDAVVAVRAADGKLRLKQSIDLVGTGAASGGLWGAMWGSLVGLLFLNPLIGFVAGGALGAGAGALSGKLADYGIKDDFIRSVGETLQPGTSALFVLVRKIQPERVLAALGDVRGRVLRSSLSPDQERRLQRALSGDAVSMPGAGAANAVPA